MEWVWITAAIGLMASVWGYIKAIWSRLIGCVIITYEFESMQESIMHWLNTKAVKSNNYRRQISSTYNSLAQQHIFYELFRNGTYLYWHGWVPLLVYKQNSDTEKKVQAELKDLHEKTLKISMIRGTIDFDNWIKEAAQNYTEREVQQKEDREAYRYCVAELDMKVKSVHLQSDFFWRPNKTYKVLSHNPEDLVPKHQTDMLDRLVYNDATQKAIQIALTWRKNQEWYKQKGIDWKTGMLLYGEPGTGKSRLAKALAQAMNVPIIPFNLVGVSDHDFREMWKAIRKTAPCVVLFEDFDNIFDGRTNITDKIDPMLAVMSSIGQGEQGNNQPSTDNKAPIQKLNFSTFLNCLDGIDNIDGIFTIITTNDITKIDEALKNRPGRIDFSLKLTKMPMEDKLKLAEKILGLGSTEYQEFVRLTTHEPETPAVVEQRCKELALQGLFRSVEL